MVYVFTRKLTRCLNLLPLTFAAAFLIPLTVMAEPGTLSCKDAHTQIDQTQKTLRPLEQDQQQLQQEVRIIYQNLFACQTSTSLTQTQQEYCTHLQKEGPKLFQAMVEVITLSHQTSQQLAHQTRQAQLTCPAIIEETFPQIASLGHS